MSSDDEFTVKIEEESPRTNQEPGDPVEEEKATFREQLLANTWQTKEDAYFWVGFFDTPSNTEEFQQLTENLDLESGNPRKSG